MSMIGIIRKIKLNKSISLVYKEILFYITELKSLHKEVVFYQRYRLC